VVELEIRVCPRRFSRSSLALLLLVLASSSLPPYYLYPVSIEQSSTWLTSPSVSPRLRRTLASSLALPKFETNAIAHPSRHYTDEIRELMDKPTKYVLLHLQADRPVV
jgi:hypothetical protein